MKRLIWTVSLGAAGVFLTCRSAPVHAEWVSLGAIIGGIIGFGFGTIFTCKNSRTAILYWALTVGMIGAVVGLEQPFRVGRFIEDSGCGLATGVVLGAVSHFVSKVSDQEKRQHRHRNVGPSV